MRFEWDAGKAAKNEKKHGVSFFPPADGTALPSFGAPIDGAAPPAGNNITYDFLPLSGGPNSGAPFPVTENFRYHCVIAPPWAPVNARGAYPPSGGFTYPPADSVCQQPQPISGASNTSPIVISVPSGTPTPSDGSYVTVAGVTGNTAANGYWMVTSANAPAGSFALEGRPATALMGAGAIGAFPD